VVQEEHREPFVQVPQPARFPEDDPEEGATTAVDVIPGKGQTVLEGRRLDLKPHALFGHEHGGRIMTEQRQKVNCY
jgi:hypothetical protein